MSGGNGGAASPARTLPPEPPIQVGQVEFDDIEALAAATRQARVEFHQTVPGRYRGAALDLELGDAGIQWGSHSLPIAARGEVVPEGAFLAAWSGAPSRANGQDLRSGLVYYPPGAEHQAQTSGAMSWVSMRVSDLAPLAAALAPGLDVGPGGPVRHVEGAPEALAILFGLLRDARRVADSGAEALRDPAARRGLRELLAGALIRVLAADPPRREAARAAAASALVRRAEEVLRERGWQPVYLSELCAAVGASEALLRQAFRAVYGVGPARHLRLRRLHLARRALRSTRRAELTVSTAAASLGFFEFGRFAGEYRELFGELPSRTPRPR